MTAEDIVIIDGLKLSRNTREILFEMQNDSPGKYLKAIQTTLDHIVQQSEDNPGNDLDTLTKILHISFLRDLIESLTSDLKIENVESSVSEESNITDETKSLEVLKNILKVKRDSKTNLSTLQKISDFIVVCANENPSRIAECMEWLQFLITLRKGLFRARRGKN